MQRVQERSAQLETTLLFFDLEWNLLDDARPRSCSPRPSSALAPPPDHPAPLPPAPALRARGADPDRDRGHRPLGLRAASSPSRPRRSPSSSPTRTRRCSSRRRSATSRAPTATRAGGRPRASPRRSARACAPARFVFNTLLPDKATKDRLRSYRALDRLAQPRQRGQRRVRRGADRGRALALRAGPALVPAEGAPPGPRPARPLRPHRPGGRVRRADPLRRRPSSWCSTATRGFSPELGEVAGEFFAATTSTRRRVPGQARRRVLLLHRARGAPLRDAQLHLAPRRRADDGPRARPRRARGAGAPAGDLPVRDPADGRRDRVDLRRVDRARPRCSSARRTPPRGSRCSPTRSTARSPRSSARWR